MAVVTGQVTTSGTAAQLGTQGAVTSLSVKAPASNTSVVFIGPAGVTTAAGYQLDPGDEIQFESSQQNGQPAYVIRVSDWYAVGTGGVVTWLAFP